MDVDSPCALTRTSRPKGAGAVDRERALGNEDVAAAECAGHLHIQGAIADLGQLEDAILVRVGQPGGGDIDSTGAAERDAAMSAFRGVGTDATFDPAGDRQGGTGVCRDQAGPDVAAGRSRRDADLAADGIDSADGAQGADAIDTAQGVVIAGVQQDGIPHRHAPIELEACGEIDRDAARAGTEGTTIGDTQRTLIDCDGTRPSRIIRRKNKRTDIVLLQGVDDSGKGERAGKRERLTLADLDAGAGGIQVEGARGAERLGGAEAVGEAVRADADDVGRVTKGAIIGDGKEAAGDVDDRGRSAEGIGAGEGQRAGSGLGEHDIGRTGHAAGNHSR